MTQPDPPASETPSPAPSPTPAAPPEAVPEPDRRPRPLIERIGMAAIALVLGTFFGGIAIAAFISGELFPRHDGRDRLPHDLLGRRPDPLPRLARHRETRANASCTP